MKIKKNNSTIQSSTGPVVDDEATAELNNSIYTDAIGFVQSAIESLGALARRTNDSKAKELIADLSVVLFDMKSNN